VVVELAAFGGAALVSLPHVWRELVEAALAS